jgi:hypothetical protein
VTNEDALAWLQRHYLEEIATAETGEEVVMILNAQHRLQPFGPDRKAWAEKPEESPHGAHGEPEDPPERWESAPKDQEDSRCRNSPPKPARKPVLCPIHRVEMEYLGFVGPLSEFTYDRQYDTWVQWPKGGP